MFYLSSPLQTELLPPIVRGVPRRSDVSWFGPWVCGRGWRGGRGDEPRSSSVQPGQLGGSRLHVELGAASSVQSGGAPGVGGRRGLFFFCLTGREEMDWVEIAQRKRKLQKNGRCLQMWLDCSATKWIDLGGVWCLCWPDVDRPVSVQRVFKAAQPVEENCFTLKARMSGKVKMKIKLEDSIHPVESMDELTNNTLITCYPDAHCTFTGIIQLFFIGGTDVAFILVWFVSWNKGYRVAVL